MISSEKYKNALYVINTILNFTRHLAYTNDKYERISFALDISEYLIRLISEAEDKTTDFRNQLQHLTKKDSMFSIVLIRFDAEPPEIW
jgi:hypothetical protein